MHLSSGQTGRATEIETFRTVNGNMESSVRSIIISYSRVRFDPLYNKGNSEFQNEKKIHRFLDPELSLILVWYLMTIRPIQR